MRGWAGKALGGESSVGRTAAEVEVVGQGRVEIGVGDRLGLGWVEGRCQIEEPGEEMALGWPAGGREGRRFVGEVEVEEDGGDDGRISEEREDPHLTTTGRTEQRQHVVDASEQDGPADLRGRGRVRCLVADDPGSTMAQARIDRRAPPWSKRPPDPSPN